MSVDGVGSATRLLACCKRAVAKRGCCYYLRHPLFATACSQQASRDAVKSIRSQPICKYIMQIVSKAGRCLWEREGVQSGSRAGPEGVQRDSQRGNWTTSTGRCLSLLRLQVSDMAIGLGDYVRVVNGNITRLTRFEPTGSHRTHAAYLAVQLDNDQRIKVQVPGACLLQSPCVPS
eukprot:1191650-Prorocentrum_minimum.AAC.4